MRSLITAIVIGVVIISIGVYYNVKIEKISTELILINEEVESLIEDEKFSEAEAQIKKLTNYLDKQSVIIEAMDNHEELTKIRMNLSELMQYTKYKIKPDALAKAKSLDTLFDHLPKNYKVKAENIL